MKNRELAQCFKEGANKGKLKNMFIEGNAIYSYGHHFPICFRLAPNKYLFNEDKYSRSTSKHQKYVLDAISGSEIIKCDTETIKNAIAGISPLVIVKKIEYDNVNDCFENIKNIYKKQGLKNVPIKKMKSILSNWEFIKKI